MHPTSPLFPRPALLTRPLRVFLALGLLVLGLLAPRGAAAQVASGRLSSGSTHSLAISANGQLYTWGRDEYGQLGNGAAMGDRAAPTRIGTASNWAQVSAGLDFSLALTTDGKLYGWGTNLYGETGNGAVSLNSVQEPTRIGTASNWVQVAAGTNHSLAVTADGQLYAWGRNSNGQLGNGVANYDRVTTPMRVGNASNWVKVAAGSSHSMALTAEGHLYVWGSNFTGQIGNGLADNNDVLRPARIGTAHTWAQITGGYGHSMAVTTDGQLYAWGRNDDGQLGNGTATYTVPVLTRIGTASNWVQVETGYGHSLALTADGQLYAWGRNDYGEVGNRAANNADVLAPVRIGAASTWVQITGGYRHSVALAADGRLYTWGNNRYGQLGYGAASGSNQFDPATAFPAVVTAFPAGSMGYIQLAGGNSHSLGVRADGQLYGWGYDNNGQVGNGATTGNVLVPARIGAASEWAQVAAGGAHSLALTADGQLYGWGQDNFGQAGNGATTGDVSEPARIGTASNWVQIAAGANHSLAVTADGQLYGWGDDAYGQVGNGAATGNVSAPTRIGTASNWVKVAAGGEHSLALTADGQLYAWGRDNYGQVGNGTATGDVSEPVRIGTASNWVQVATGGYHSLALTADGQLYAWGRDNYGQVGNGTATGDVLAPVRISTDGIWTQVASGVYHSLALTAEGHLYAWGGDLYGEVGNGATTGNVLAPTREITAGTWTQLGRGSFGFLSLALNGVGEMQSAGSNGTGQLGDGTRTNASTFARNQAPLPVELVAFTATAAGRVVRLAWATASEKNSQVFEVERSFDGRTFAPIGTVAAAGSSSAPRSYELLDGQLPASAALLYYRLRQVDLDGTFSYSPVRTVALTGAAAGLSLYPNPAHGAATLTGTVPGAVITVYDALGREVLATTADATGTAALVLPAGLPTGVYVVRAGSKAVRLTVE